MLPLTASHGMNDRGHADRLRAYLVRLRRSESRKWSQQHEDAWRLLNSLRDLLDLLQGLDQLAEGNNIHITLALRTHGRETEADRRRAKPNPAPIDLTVPTPPSPRK